MKTTSLYLYCTAHASEGRLGLAIIAAVCYDGKNYLFKRGRGGRDLRFLGDFSGNHTNWSKLGSLPGNTGNLAGMIYPCYVYSC